MIVWVHCRTESQHEGLGPDWELCMHACCSHRQACMSAQREVAYKSRQQGQKALRGIFEVKGSDISLHLLLYSLQWIFISICYHFNIIIYLCVDQLVYSLSRVAAEKEWYLDIIDDIWRAWKSTMSQHTEKKEVGDRLFVDDEDGS